MPTTTLLTKTFGATRSFKALHKVLWMLPATIFVAGESAYASSATWNTTSTSANWSDTGNWAGGVAPGNTTAGATATTDTATFNSTPSTGDGNTAGTPIIIDSGRTIGSIAFGSSAGAFFIGSTGGNALYLSSGGSISNATTTASVETINAPLILAGAGATYSFTSNSTTAADTLNFGGTISGGTAGATVLTLNGTNTGANTISGNISNGSATTLAITKSGTGLWVLSGSNNYSGATTLSGGTLQYTGTAAMSTSSAVTVNNGATLGLFANTGTYSPSSIAFTNGGTSTITVNSSSSTQTVTLANETANGGASNTTIAVTSTTTGETLQFTNFTPNSNSGSAWGGAQNIFNLSGANVILNGITFGADGVITLNSSTGNSLTINGNIGDTSSNRTLIGIVNSGTLVLNNTVSYPGGGTNKGFAVNLAGGTLDVNNAGAINSTASVGGNGNRGSLQITGGTLDNTSGGAITESANPTVAINGNFTYGGTNSLNMGTGAVTLGVSTATITASGSGTLTFGGVVSGTSDGITLASGSTSSVALGAANTYTGATTISGGTLILGTGGTTGLLSTSSAITDNGTFAIDRSNTVTQGTDFSASAISGTGTFVQMGTGTTVLNAANSFTIAKITAGTLQLGASGALGTGTVQNSVGATLDLNGQTLGNALVNTASGSFNGTITNSSNSTATVSSGYNLAGTAGLVISDFTINGTGNIIWSGAIDRTNGAGTITKSGTNTLTLAGQGSSYAGEAYTASGGALAFNMANGSTFSSGNIANTANVIGAESSGITNTIATVISGTGTFTQSGAGTTILTGSNTYTGSTTIGNGTLQLGNGGTTGSLATTSTITDNGVLAFDRSNAVVQGTDFSGAVLTGTGGLAQLGSGTTTLNVANTITGTTTINNGAILITNSSALQNSLVSVGATNGLAFGSAITSATIGGLAGSGSESLMNTAGTPAAVALTVGNNNTSGSFAGVLSGSGSLIKTGTGTQSFGGASADTFTGGTTVNAGTLLLDESTIGSNIFATTSTITLNGGNLTIAGPASGTGAQTLANLSLAANTASNLTLNANGGTAANLTATTLSVGGSSQLFLNLVNAGSGVFLTNLTVNQIQPWSIVQDSTGIGLGITNASKDLVRAASSALTATSNNSSTNFTTTGSSGATVTNSVGNVAINSLFIDAGATATGTTTTWDLGGTANTATLTSGAIGVYGPNNFTITDGKLSSGTAITLNNMGTGTLTVGAAITGSSQVGTYGNIVLSGNNAYTGGLYINSGTVKAGSSTAAGTGNLTVNTGTLDMNGNSLSVGAIGGGGSILNNGATAATLTIGGNSTINSLTMANGTGGLALVVGNATVFNNNTTNVTFTGGITLNNGANLQSTAGFGGAVWGTNTITVAANASTFIGSGGLGTEELISNNIILNSGASLDLYYNANRVNGGGGVYGNITGGGNTTVFLQPGGSLTSAWNVGGNNSGFTGTLVFEGTAGSTNLTTATSGGSGAIWKATTSGGVNLTGTGTYNVAELISAASTGNIFMNTGANLNLGDTTSNTVSYGGTLAGGTANLTKSGTDTQQFNGSTLSYTGSTTVSGGTMALIGSSLTGTPSVTVSGGTFSEDSASSVTSAATYNVSGTANLSGANGAITASTINSGGVINLGNGTSNGSLTGSITDNGGFNVNGGTTAETIGNKITGTGSVMLADRATGNSYGNTLNTYSGGTTITAGQWTATTSAFGTGDVTVNPTGTTNVEVDTSGGGSIANGVNLTVNNGTGTATGTGLLVLNEVTQSVATLNGSGSLVLNNGGNGTVLTVGNNTTNSTFSGSISDGSASDSAFGGALVKTGTDKLTLSGSNTFTNFGGVAPYATEVQQGILNIQNGAALGYDAAAPGGHNAYNGAAVDSGATLQMQGGITVTANPLTISGSGASGATGALENVSGNNAYDAGITLAGNTTIASDAGKLTIDSTSNSNVPAPGVLGGSGNITLVGAGNGIINDSIQMGSSGLTMNGTGTWTLGGVNTYSGPTNLNSGTTIINGSTAAGSTVTVGDGAATLMGTGTISGPLVTAANGTGIIAPGASVGGVGTLHVGSLGFTIGAGTTFDYDINTSNAIGGTGNDLIAMGGGTLTVGGSGIVFNFNQLTSLTTGVAYTLIDGANSVSGFSASDFSATGIGSDGAVFSLSGDNLIVTFTSANTGDYYYNGSTSTDFTDYHNYYQTISGTAQDTALSSTSNVYLSANSPSNNAPVVNSNITINTLNFNGNGAGDTLSGSGTVTLAASGGTGIADSAGGATTETISAPIALGSNQTWAVTNSGNTLNITGAISGAHSLALTGSGKYKLAAANTFSGLTVGTGSDTPTLLLANGGNGSATGAGALTVKTGATIGGAGTGLTGTAFATSFQINGNVIVGNGTDATSSLKIAAPASGTVDGTISGASLSFNLNSANTNANLLDLGSTNVTFSSTALTLNLLGVSTISPGTSYTLLTDAASFNSSTDGLTTTMVNGKLVITGGLSIANSTYFGASVNGFTTGQYPGSFLYISGDNIDVEVVPEPGTWAMMLGGLALLILIQHRRNRNER